jgi:hypothetical protein
LATFVVVHVVHLFAGYSSITAGGGGHHFTRLVQKTFVCAGFS